MLYQCPFCKELTSINIDSSYICPHCKNIVNIYNPDDFVINGHTLKRYIGTKKDVVIPKEVKEIGDFAFSLNRDIENVYLHEAVTSIGNEAFSKALNFKLIYLPKSLIIINNYAFLGCDKLTIITDHPNKPNSWSPFWNSSKNPVIWGFNKYYVDEQFQYVLNKNNEVFLAKINDKSIEELDLTNLYQYQLKGICRCCFEDCINLKSIILPDSLQYIGEYAFKNCINLSNITLPKKLLFLGKYAFDNCQLLSKIVIPEQLHCLEMDSFSNGCLKELIVLSNKTIIMRGTEWGRRHLKTLILPEDMKDINELVFKGCTSLSYMKISKNIRGKFTIPTKCIVKTYEDEEHDESQPTKMIRILERIEQGISVKVTFLDRRAYRYNCYYKAEVGDIVYAIYKGEKIKGVVVDYLDKISTLPNVNTIVEVYRMVPEDYDFNRLDEGFFNNTQTIDKVLFALDRLKEGTVSNYYFNVYTNYLKKVFFINGNGIIKYLLANYEYDYIDILCTNQLIIHSLDDVIEYCAINNHIMMIPKFLAYQNDSSIAIEMDKLSSDYIIKNNQLINEVNLPNSLVFIEEDVFKDTYINRVNFYGKIKDYLNVEFSNLYSNPLINNGDFYYYDNELIMLKEIVIENVHKINDYTFAFINSLEKVVIKDGVKEIGFKAFMDCYNLKEVILPETITNIGNSAFSGTKIKEFIVPSKVSIIKTNMFMNCRELENIIIHQNVTQIENYSFYSCVSLKTITLPEKLESIGEYCFANCRLLTSIVIPNSVKMVGGNCFLACVSLQSVSLSRQLRSIMAFTFRMCSSLERIVIPNSVRKIGSFAFDKCINLKEIILSSSIKTIGLRAFKECSSLERFLVPYGMESIGLCAFENCFSLRVVFIPRSVVSIENNVFIGCKNLIICLEISEDDYKNYGYSYYGLDNLLSSCVVKWNYKINRK